MRLKRAAHRTAPAPTQKTTLHALIQAYPARFALGVFTLLILIWTTLLSLPVASADGTRTPLADALFTAVSAICVTGLSTVNMAQHWSMFGDIVVLLGFQIGGIGVLTLASLLAVSVTGRLGLRQRLLAASDANPGGGSRGTNNAAVGLGEIGGLLGAVAISLLVIEGVLTALIAPRLMIAGHGFWQSLREGVYLAASAFTNTGFVPIEEGLAPFSTDPYMLSVLAVGVFLGSIGFPVIFALYRYFRRAGWRGPRRLGLHAKLTLTTTALLVLLGWVAITGLEWNNPGTLAQQNVFHTLLSALYMSIMTRSGGLAIMDPADMNGSTMFVMDILMFIGGGSASTAGGIKVTTIAVLFLAAWAEARGYHDVQAFERSIPVEVLRLAVSIVIWGATIVAAATITLMHMTKVMPLDVVLFEVISAFGTCGLSAGITAELPDAGKYVLAATMWAGRIGTVTLAAAIAATSRRRMFRLPEERPIVG